MEKNSKYFHEDYFIKILNMIKKGNYNQALLEFQKYIIQYPHDLEANVFYADLLIRFGKLDEAESTVFRAENLINEKTPVLSIKDFKTLKIKLLCCQKKYEECYKLLLESEVCYKGRWMNFEQLLIYLRKVLGILDANYYSVDSYLLKQILFYDEYLGIQHIKKHQSLTNINELQFKSDFPLEEIFYRFRNMLPMENKFISNEISDYYIFKYLGNGHFKHRLVDYIKVVTLRDSNDIITMYPYENKEKADCIDITPAFEEDLKLKRKSQIDKFNERLKKSGK